MYLLDSNVYIRAFTRPADVPDFQSFHRQLLPHILLSSVVVHELLVGATAPDRRRQVEKGLIEPFRTRGRIHTPGLSTWKLAAEGDRRLRALGTYSGSLLQRSFANDLLIAATARELGATILTYNTRDFLLIARVMPLKVALPWPEPTPH